MRCPQQFPASHYNKFPHLNDLGLGRVGIGCHGHNECEIQKLSASCYLYLDNLKSNNQITARTTEFCGNGGDELDGLESRSYWNIESTLRKRCYPTHYL
jgi:hypothetical protein